MRITRDMKIKEVLSFGEEKMIEAFVWLAPEFGRLRHAGLRRAMSGRVSVGQAARVARVPLTEMLYVLNLAAGGDSDGADEDRLADELRASRREDFEFRETNPPLKPSELLDAEETDERVKFVDLMPQHDAQLDPMPAVVRGLRLLRNADDILLLRHPFDPVPLRDLLARRRGLASWAEERTAGVWHIYFYRPAAAARAAAHPPINNRVFLKSFAKAA